ncbi:MAG: AAA family ATPase [Alphaproteobacteria bacterium]|nr:AAA family ATPase [Alphaproteobacteria bacterium]
MASPQLQRLDLTNIRCFEHLEMDFVSRPDAGGQWTVLLGDNGVGKTTILRSICVVADVHPLNETHSIARAHGVRMHRIGTGKGRIELSDHRGFRRAFFSGNEGDGGMWLPRPLPPDPLRLYTYGSSRGSALGGPDRAVDLGDPRYFTSTLFSPNARLIHAETWLRKLAFGALRSKGGPPEALFEAVLSTITGLLPGVTGMDVTEDSVTVQGEHFAGLGLDNLSDGYLTTLGWTLDMLARWVEAERREGRNPDGDIAKQIEALVLVDELDLHLHPRWQRHVMDDLRAAFPNTSFVVTTHSPLTVQSARPGETWVLRQGDDGIEVLQRDPIPGSDADDILTGDLFGLPSTLDNDTLRLLDAHRELLRSGVKRTDKARVALEQQIRERIGPYAETPDERAEMESLALTGDETDLLKARFAALRGK